jgi:sortase A
MSPPDPPPLRHTSDGRSRRHFRSSRANRNWSVRQKLSLVLACAAIAGGLVISARIVLYLHHSATSGKALVQTEQRAIDKAYASGQCKMPAAAPSAAPALPVDAILKVPKVGLVAPVLQGIDDPELNVGVGHVPASSWPALSGTDVLSAHDVTWFSHIDQLKLGDSISIVTPCYTFDYTVLNHNIVVAGTPIYQTVSPRLILETCYPLNALFLTSQRYLVEASLTKLETVGKVSLPPSTAAPLPTITAPAPLEAEGLDLSHNEQPLGVLSFGGTPSPIWQQSSGPLNAEALTLELYFAALRSANQNQPTWWAAIAPTVPFADIADLVNSQIVSNAEPVQPTLDVSDTTLNGASISTALVLKGSSASGIYSINMTSVVQDGHLLITAFSIQPRR